MCRDRKLLHLAQKSWGSTYQNNCKLYVFAHDDTVLSETKGDREKKIKNICAQKF